MGGGVRPGNEARGLVACPTNGESLASVVGWLHVQLPNLYYSIIPDIVEGRMQIRDSYITL